MSITFSYKYEKIHMNVRTFIFSSGHCMNQFLSNLRKLKYIVQFNKKSMFTGSQAYTIKPDPGAAGC